MTDPLLTVTVAAVASLVIAYLWFVIWKFRYTRAVRAETLLRSQAVTAGKVYEQLVPYFPGFGFNPKDARFLGSPVDLVVFDGLSEGQLRRVVFIEVKTEQAQLSAREKSVRAVVESGRVAWAEIRTAT